MIFASGNPVGVPCCIGAVCVKKIIYLLLAVLVAGFVYWACLYKSPQEKHFVAVLAAAKQGDKQAQVQVADLYTQGIGTPVNVGQAIFWYRKAALEGDRTAAWKCAQIYIQGQLIPQDLEEAASFLLLSAKENSVSAQEELSRFYAQGMGGLLKHPGESLYWLFQAAKGGSMSAKEALVRAQKDTPELYEQVEKFLTDLSQAQAGDGPARLRVGQAYQTGQPVLQNMEEAQRWLSLAWEENKLPQAGFILVQLYQKGELAAQEPDKEASLWNELVHLPYPPAQYALGETAYQEQPPRYEDAFAWFSNAAANGYAPGQYMTGFMLMRGQGTDRSVKLAITFFRSAAEQDYVSAQYVLGQIYWKGLGVPADKKAGRKWLEKAAAAGNVAAQELLDTK